MLKDDAHNFTNKGQKFSQLLDNDVNITYTATMRYAHAQDTKNRELIVAITLELMLFEKNFLHHNF